MSYEVKVEDVEYLRHGGTPYLATLYRPQGPGPLPMPLQPLLVGPALQRVARVAATQGSGGQQLVTYFVGQVVGAMNTVKPTRRVVLEMVEEFIDAVERLDDLVQSE